MNRLQTLDPAAPEIEAKRRLTAAVDAARGEIIDLSHRIHANPEPAYEEHQAAAWCAYGIVDQGDDPTTGSTDMADVSWVVPAIHPDLAIVSSPTPGRSILFRDAAAMPEADETTLLAATLVAQTAYDLYADPGLVGAH